MDGNESGLAVVIPNFNGSDMLRQCLDSLDKQSLLPDEVIVVDNASTDDSVPMVRSRFPHVKLMIMETNTGFAGGVNIGFRSAMGSERIRYLAVINNDAFIDNNWVRTIVDFLNKNPKAGACQGKVIFTGERGINTLGVVPLRDGGAFNLGIGSPDVSLPTFEIFGVSGAAAVYRKEALADVGLFDEDFFMYMEDVDLAWRLRWSGWTSHLIGGAVAIHAHSASNRDPSRKMYHVMRNSNYVCMKNLPFTMVLALPISFVAVRLMGAMSKRERFNSMTKGISQVNLAVLTAKAFLNLVPDLSSLMAKRHVILGKRREPLSMARVWIERFGSDLGNYLIDLDKHV